MSKDSGGNNAKLIIPCIPSECQMSYLSQINVIVGKNLGILGGCGSSFVANRVMGQRL